ncbi:MAG: hypothetical protein LCH81_00155 [Bacteroidetes bacterium]|nr:hypothetical protein [Bacteroidota bacterium]
MIKVSSATVAAFIWLFIAAISFFYYPKWKNAGTESTLSWDVSGYYWYLPAVFIYKDVKHLEFSQDILKKYQCTPDFQQALPLPNGNMVLKYSSGLALQYLPFFAVAHAVAAPLGYAPDGFSTPYQLAIHIGGLLMCLIGLFFLRKVLLQYFSDRVVSIVLLCLVFATNYLNFAAIDMPQTHNWLFTWYAILLYLSDRFYRQPGLGKAAGIGAVVGICALTRPTDFISVLIPLFWGMPSLRRDAIRERLRFIRHHAAMYTTAMVITALIGSIQLCYWKYVSGHWLVYSYGEQSFSWLKPHVYYYMFSARTGWLVYTPVMLFALLGLISLYRMKINFWALFLFILINTYIVTAWDIWWYGGRAMVQSYAVLSFPLAAFIAAVEGSKIKKTLFYVVLAAFAYYNLWYTHQMHRGGLVDPYNMTRPYFWAVLGRFKVPEETVKLYDTRYIYTGNRKEVKEIFFDNFDADTTLLKAGKQFNGTPCEFVGAGKEYTQIASVPLEPGAATWLRLSADFKCSLKEWENWRMPQLCVMFKDGTKNVKGYSIRMHRFLNNGDQKNLYIDVKLPKKTFHSVDLYVWNPGSPQELLIDNMRAELYEEE